MIVAMLEKSVRPVDVSTADAPPLISVLLGRFVIWSRVSVKMRPDDIAKWDATHSRWTHAAVLGAAAYSFRMKTAMTSAASVLKGAVMTRTSVLKGTVVKT